jgi:hypothetical protein
VVHGDEEPLRHHLAVAAAELGDVGVDGQLLARDHQVGEGDGRLHDGTVREDRAGRVDEHVVVQERLDAGDPRLEAVGVLLTEVVRAGTEHAQALAVGVAGAAPAAKEVAECVVALGEPDADGAVDVLLAVHAVATEASAQLDHGGGALLAEELVDLDGRVAGRRGGAHGP